MGRKFTIFSFFYFVFEGKFQVQAPRGAHIWTGDLTEGFLHYDFGGLILILEGLIHGGAYFQNFMVYDCTAKIQGTFQVYQISEDTQPVAYFFIYRSESEIKSELNKPMPFTTFQVCCILSVSHTQLLEPYQIEQLRFSIPKDS